MSENNKFRLTSVHIEKMWGHLDIKTKIQDVNLFVGSNGSGKTTFINIIEAVANFDCSAILRLNFKSCLLSFSRDTYISCTRFVDEEDDDIVMFKITISGEVKFEDTIDVRLTLDKKSRLRRRISRNSNSYEREYFPSLEYDRILEILKIISTTAWISVERTYFDDDESSVVNRSYGVNGKLSELIRQIEIYKAHIELKEKELLESFRKKTFQLMLFDAELDRDINLDMTVDDEWSKHLYKVFKDLGMDDSATKKKISLHVTEMNKSIKLLHRKTTVNSKNIDNVLKAFAMRALYLRTQKLVELLKEFDAQRAEIRKQFQLYLDTLAKFITKKIEGIHDVDAMSEKIFEATDLSSGEKQIIILLTETLLQSGEPALFIADEPELSLHVTWQTEIVGAIRGLNKNAQLIFATHSPEVIANWRDSVIEMDKISSSGDAA